LSLDPEVNASLRSDAQAEACHHINGRFVDVDQFDSARIVPCACRYTTTNVSVAA
jgi:hypothetical protein